MNIKNMTPHSVKLLKDDGSIVEIRPESIPARVEIIIEPLKLIDGINLVFTTYNSDEAAKVLPEIEGVYYIVSNVVKQAFPDRKDLLSPSGLIRDFAGNVVCCKYLSI